MISIAVHIVFAFVLGLSIPADPKPEAEKPILQQEVPLEEKTPGQADTRPVS